MSLRQQIFDRIKGYLEGTEIYGKLSYVTFNDPIALEHTELPAICVEFAGEQLQTATIGWPRTLEKSMAIRITCVSSRSSGLNELLEEYATRIEMRLQQSEEVAHLESERVISLTLQSVEPVDLSMIATNSGGYTLLYELVYSVEENDLNATL